MSSQWRALTNEEREYIIKSIRAICPVDLEGQIDIASHESLEELTDRDLQYLAFVKVGNHSLRWVKDETWSKMILEDKNYFTNEQLSVASDDELMRLTTMMNLIIYAARDLRDRAPLERVIKKMLRDNNVKCDGALIQGGAFIKSVERVMIGNRSHCVYVMGRKKFIRKMGAYVPLKKSR